MGITMNNCSCKPCLKYIKKKDIILNNFTPNDINNLIHIQSVIKGYLYRKYLNLSSFKSKASKTNNILDTSSNNRSTKVRELDYT